VVSHQQTADRPISAGLRRSLAPSHTSSFWFPGLLDNDLRIPAPGAAAARKDPKSTTCAALTGQDSRIRPNSNPLGSMDFCNLERLLLRIHNTQSGQSDFVPFAK
jgi:hypothetical protein